MEVGGDGIICSHQNFPGAETWKSSGYVLKRRCFPGGLEEEENLMWADQEKKGGVEELLICGLYTRAVQASDLDRVY